MIKAAEDAQVPPLLIILLIPLVLLTPPRGGATPGSSVGALITAQIDRSLTFFTSVFIVQFIYVD